MLCTLPNVRIEAVASYLPSTVRTFDALRSLYGSKVVDLTVKNSGIQSLRVADKNQTSLDMCVEAAELLFAESGFPRDEVDAVVMVSQTFDFLGPASSIILQDRLGFGRETVCFDIIYGCSGYVYGLYQAALLISSGSCRNVLLVNGETNTRLMDEDIKDQYMVFGDAASATLVSRGDSSLSFHIASDGRRHGCVVNLVNGFRAPVWINQGKMPIGPNGNYAKAVNDGMAVFDFILHEGADTIRTMCDYVGWSLSEVDFFPLHQATKVTLGFLTRRLGIPPEKAPFVSEFFGNTSSVTIPLVMTTCARKNEYHATSWRKVIIAAFGLGLSWGSVACDLSRTRFYGPANLEV